MNNFHPKVSIIIPVYNGSNFLKDAIDSALAQTYKNIEIIIVNDGSNDKGATEKIAKSYGKKINYFKKENGGVATALNFGIEKMTGEYFSWLSHDDMYEVNKIEDQVNFLLSKNNKNLIVASNVKILFDDERIENKFIDKKLFEYFEIFLAIDSEVGLNGCSLIIPKKALLESHGFDVNLPVTQDYDLWHRLSKKYKFVLLEKNLIISRRHKLQDSVTKQHICFDASDKMHYDFLNEITFERFRDYIKDNGIEKILVQYNIYKNAGYIKTASMIFKNITRYYYEINRKAFSDFFGSEVGRIVSSDIINKNKNKKRILFFSNVWHKGGIERVLSYIFNNLGGKYDFFLVTNDDKSEENFGFEIPENVSYIKINNQDQIKELINILSLFDIDIFVGNPNFLVSLLPIYATLKGTNVKSIAYNHGYYFLPYMYEYLYKSALGIRDAYSNADVVVWLTQISCNIYGIENNNGLYIPNPVKIDKITKSKTIINKKLLAVGRFDDAVKRIDRIILLYKEILKIDREYRLDVVGYCSLNLKLQEYGNITIEEFIKENGIPIKNINFRGQQQDVQKFYNDASFLIMTSTCEGFPLVLVEALSRGLPCACFEYLGIEEIIQNGSNGWLSSQDDYATLAHKVVSTINNREKYFEMSNNSTNSVKKYDVKIFCKKWESLIESITGSNIEQDLGSLQPRNRLSTSNCMKVISEYEKYLNIVTKSYVLKETLIPTPIVAKRIDRLISNLKLYGFLQTFQKITDKIYKKIFRK